MSSKPTAAGTMSKPKKATAEVELSFMCSQLLNRDKLSKSDPFLILFAGTTQPQSGTEQWLKVGRTEVIDDNLNPQVLASYIDYYY